MFVMIAAVSFGQYQLNYPDIRIGSSNTGKVALKASNILMPHIGIGSGTDSVLTIVGGVVKKVPRSQFSTPYTAGYGMSLVGQQFRVDTSLIASKSFMINYGNENYIRNNNTGLPQNATVDISGQIKIGSNSVFQNSPLVIKNIGGISGANNDIPVELLKIAYAGLFSMNYKYQPDAYGVAYVPYDTAFAMHALEAGIEGISIHGMRPNVAGGTDNNLDDRLIFKAGATGVRTYAPNDVVNANQLAYKSWIQNFTGVYAENTTNPLYWSSGASNSTPFGYYRKDGLNITPSFIQESSNNDSNSQYNVFRKSRGSLVSPSATLSLDTLGGIIGEVYDGSNYVKSSFIKMVASENANGLNSSGAIVLGGANSGSKINQEWVKIQNGQLGVGLSPISSSILSVKQKNNYGIGIEAINNDSRLFIGNNSGEWNFSATYDINGTYQPIQFYTSDQRRMTIGINGNVGIDTTSPNAKLDVNGSARASSNDGNANTLVRNTDLSTYVTTNTNQTVTGSKTFSNTTYFTGGVVSGSVGYQDSGFINLLQSGVLSSNVTTFLPATGGQLVNTLFTGTKQVKTASGNGSATTISIAHGMTGVTTASWVSATANNAASAGIQYVTVDATNINIFYTVAPASGTNNLLYSIEIKP